MFPKTHLPLLEGLLQLPEVIVPDEPVERVFGRDLLDGYHCCCRVVVFCCLASSTTDGRTNKMIHTLGPQEQEDGAAGWGH